MGSPFSTTTRTVNPVAVLTAEREMRCTERLQPLRELFVRLCIGYLTGRAGNANRIPPTRVPASDRGQRPGRLRF